MSAASALEGSAEEGRPGILVIVGPTAVGKSACAMAAAERFGGEIVSVDSMQVYRGLDAATSKPGAGERRSVPHHGLDLAEPGDQGSGVLEHRVERSERQHHHVVEGEQADHEQEEDERRPDDREDASLDDVTAEGAHATSSCRPNSLR